MYRFTQMTLIVFSSLILSHPVTSAQGYANPESTQAQKAHEFKVHVGDDAPAFNLRAYNEEVALRLVKSPLASLNHFVGLHPEFPKQVVLVGFFAAWNPQSQAELAVLQKTYKRFKDDDVMVLMISLDNKDIEGVYEAIEKAKVTYPVLRDRFGVVSKRYGVTKLPTLLIIDKEGRIASIGEGYETNIESYLEGEIRALLGVQ